MTLSTRGIATWIGENQQLVVAAAAGVAGLGALGTALIGLGLTLKLASVGVYALSAGFGLLSMAINLPIRLTLALTSTMKILTGTFLVTKTSSLLTAAALGTLNIATKILQGTMFGLRVALALLQAGLYATVGVAYSAVAAFFGLRAACYTLHASSKVAYVGFAVFNTTLKMLSGTVLAVSFNFRAWLASLVAVQTATQAAGTSLVVYNSAARSSTALTATLATSTRLICVFIVCFFFLPEYHSFCFFGDVQSDFP